MSSWYYACSSAIRTNGTRRSSRNHVERAAHVACPPVDSSPRLKNTRISSPYSVILHSPSLLSLLAFSALARASGEGRSGGGREEKTETRRGTGGNGEGRCQRGMDQRKRNGRVQKRMSDDGSRMRGESFHASAPGRKSVPRRSLERINPRFGFDSTADC